MKTALSLFLTSAFLTSECLATVYQRFADLPKGTKYDYVIVGGGVGGSVLANRLSEVPANQVLLLEAGGNNVGITQVDTPLLVTQIPTTYMWNYTTVKQPGLNGNSIPYARGFVLGGSSCINGMFYTRGSSEDFDRFAKVTGDPGWNWKNIKKYFDKSEKWTPPADNHNTTGEFTPSVHSMKGGVHAVSLQGFPDAIHNMVFDAAEQIGAPFQYLEDINAGNLLGLGHLQVTIDRDTRSSASASYLAEPIRTRKNLHILLNARASRVLPTDGKKTFKTVEFAQDLNGPFLTVQAGKELIISSGAIGTPQILLNSGIGDSSYLKSVGISTLVDLPSVGKNLTDQPSVSNVWAVNSTDTFDTLFRDPALLEAATLERKVNHTGPLVDTPASQIAWFRLNDTFGTRDPAPGRKSPHLELVFANGFFAPTDAGNFLTVATNLISPVARGSIKLDRSTPSPFNNPLIDPAFYTTDFDIRAQVEGVKQAIRFVSAPAFDGYILENNNGLTLQSTDADIETYVRNTSQTSAHPVGSAGMSAKGASYGVVDPDLRVKGLSGLRIVDASVFPFSPSAHPQSVTYVFAERAADMIKAVH